MRSARIWLSWLACLLVLAVLAIWQVPQWLDWGRYRDTIEGFASATLGRRVTIEGPIELTLLPEPILTATKVHIGEGAADVSIHVKALRLRVALWPLLGGHVDARDLVLRGADMRIASPTESSVLRARPPEWLAAFSAHIEDGGLTLGRLAFTGINATLRSADTGAISASGSALFNGQDWHFTARLTSSGSDGAAGFDATLDGEGQAAGFGVSLSGRFAADGSFNGNISSRGPNLAMLLPAPAVPFRADGRLTAGGGLIVADNLLLQIGGSPASGAVALRLAPQQRLDVALSASRLDLDAWLPVLANASNSVAGIDLPIGIDFSASAASLGSDTLENVQAAFEVSNQALVLRDGSALLPGNGNLRLSGSIGHADSAHLRFEGEAKVEAPLLRPTLRWLSNAAPEWLPNYSLSHLPESVLQQADLSAHVIAERSDLLLQHVRGRIDTSAVAGDFRLQRGNALSLSAKFTADHATLNDWIPALASASQKLDARNLAIGAEVANDGFALRQFDANIDGLQVSASGQLSKDQQITSGKLTIDAREAVPLAAMLPASLRATPALWHGPIHLSLRADGPPNALSIAAKLSLDGASLNATPTIDLRSGSWNGELTMRHPGARRLLAAMGLPEALGLPNLPDWLGDGSLSLVTHIHGTANEVSADSFDLTAGSLRLDGTFSLDDTGSEPHLATQLHTSEMQIPLPSTTSAVPLPIDVLHGWRGDIALDAGVLMLGSDVTLHDASAIVRVSNGAARIERLVGGIGHGKLEASGLFNGTNPPSFALKIRLDQATMGEAVAGTPIDLADGLVDGNLDVSGAGFSPATIVATLAGHLALTASDGAITGFDLSGLGKAAQQRDPVAAQKAAGEALTSGMTRFERLDIAGDLAHGDLTISKAHLRGDAGEADATGDINLPSQTLDLRIALQPAIKDTPAIALRMFGPFAHPQQTSELANLARFVAERTH